MQRSSILLVEDEDALARLVQAVFDEMADSVSVHRVVDVDEALKFLTRQGPYTYMPEAGLVLLDLNLPRRHGYELLEAMLGNPRLKHIPVVIFSTADSPLDRAKSLALGATAHIGKPWTFDDYERIMNTVVKMIPKPQNNEASTGA